MCGLADLQATGDVLRCGETTSLDDVRFWPNADVGTRLSIRPLSWVNRTCGGHALTFRV
jgi:hypothetical protein